MGRRGAVTVVPHLPSALVHSDWKKNPKTLFCSSELFHVTNGAFTAKIQRLKEAASAVIYGTQASLSLLVHKINVFVSLQQRVQAQNLKISPDVV